MPTEGFSFVSSHQKLSDPDKTTRAWSESERSELTNTKLKWWILFKLNLNIQNSIFTEKHKSVNSWFLMTFKKPWWQSPRILPWAKKTLNFQKGWIGLLIVNSKIRIGLCLVETKVFRPLDILTPTDGLEYSTSSPLYLDVYIFHL